MHNRGARSNASDGTPKGGGSQKRLQALLANSRQPTSYPREAVLPPECSFPHLV